MKPLHLVDTDSFLSRFGNFIDAEIRSIDPTSATTINILIACQDSARGFDWLTLRLEFSGVSEASLVDNSQLVYLDMSDGISLTNKYNNFLFNIKNATISLTASNIKYEEGLF